MKSKSAPHAAALALLAVALSAAAPLSAAGYLTTYTFNVPGGTPLVTKLVHEWHTALASGTVSETDLTDWSVNLYDGDTLVYSDSVIVGGAVQPIGGVGRDISGLTFSFDLGAQNLLDFDNDVNVIQAGASIGATYNIYPTAFDSSIVNLEKYLNGAYQEADSLQGLATEDTTLIAVPEPSAYALLSAGLAMGFATLRRRSRRA